MKDQSRFNNSMFLKSSGAASVFGFAAPAFAIVAFQIVQMIWQRWWFIIIVILLAGWAIVAFERHRASRVRDINAALSESEKLTKQLTEQQAELGRANRALALDYAVTRALIESPTPVEAALRILQTICICAGWDVGAIWDIDIRSNAIRCVGIWQKPLTGAARFEPPARGQTSLPGTGLSKRVFASRKPHWVADIARCGNSRRAVIDPKASLRSGFGLPILAGSEVIGILEFYSREIRQPDGELIQIMSSIGSHIGQLIQQKRVEDALNRSKEERLLELQRVRKRIATDLHDDVGSSLTKIALLSEAVRQNISDKHKDASERLATVTEISNELVETMSDIVWAINPQKDYLSDLSQRMRRFASDIFTARQISFQ